MRIPEVVEEPKAGLYCLANDDRPQTVRRSESANRLLFRIADTICSLAAFFLAYAILPWVKSLASATLLHSSIVYAVLSPAANGPGLPSRLDLLWVFVVASLAVALILEYAGGERPLPAQSVWHIVRTLLVSMVAAMSAVATVLFALRVPPYSRIFLGSYLAIFFVLALGYRLTARAAESCRQRSGESARRVIVAGRAEGIARFLSATADSPGALARNIAGCLRVGPPSLASSPDIDFLGDIGDLGELLIHRPIDQVIVVLPEGEAAWLPDVIEHCDYFRVGLQIIHERLLDVRLRDLLHLNTRFPVPAIGLIPEEELTTGRVVWKRSFDVVLSFLALGLLSPLMAAIAAAIKITTPRLPVFYRWNVVGYHGRRFTGYKFTTMVADADDRKAELSQQNEMSGPVFKIRNDPRVTPLGRFLRKYSLNELPQLWSVLVGDMSLVGPRPAGPHELLRYAMWHKRKLSVQPGITCFWQVRGRNEISNFDDWVRMDLEYIRKRGFWTDMAILCQTVVTVLRGTGC